MLRGVIHLWHPPQPKDHQSLFQGVPRHYRLLVVRSLSSHVYFVGIPFGWWQASVRQSVQFQKRVVVSCQSGDGTAVRIPTRVDVYSM